MWGKTNPSIVLMEVKFIQDIFNPAPFLGIKISYANLTRGKYIDGFFTGVGEIIEGKFNFLIFDFIFSYYIMSGA